MGSQTEHSDHQNNGHSHQQGHAGPSAFTPAQLALIATAHKHQQFEGHHHHSHHKHYQYRRPFNIDTNLGLFALKKLNAINPEFLQESEKRLLQPVAPGAITHLGYGGLLAGSAWYAFYAWRTVGLVNMLQPKTMIPLAVLLGSLVGFQVVSNYAREVQWTLPRSNLVDKYKQQYGEKFLLDVLQPTFRLPEANESK